MTEDMDLRRRTHELGRHLVAAGGQRRAAEFVEAAVTGRVFLRTA
jgi:hypothetical protein